MDIISEGNSVQYIDESIHDVKNSLNNLQLLAQQMDNLAEMNTPDFVNKNVDLIKILNIIVENLKSLAAQKILNWSSYLKLTDLWHFAPR
ncbi:MAG: hypothetical protein IPG53_03920 [Ignavibacteriales bacterium]|nr:hypothetical protein [Ignavibacteriales bacterium]